MADARSRRGTPTAAPPTRWRVTIILGLAALLALPLLAWLARGAPGWPASAPDEAPTALILDQLSLTDPNPAFVAEATALLEAAGLRVDYVPGEEATVALHRGLPARGDELLIIRSHAARISELAADGETIEEGEDVAVFSGEPIDPDRYTISGVPAPAATAAAVSLSGEDGPRWAEAETLPPAQVAQLMPVFYDPASGEMPFFGIRPDFVARHFEGAFPGTTVLMMGCDGLRGPAMAEAFLGRGAGAYVSWDRSVSAMHTDATTLRLLERWLRDGEALGAAVTATMDELGPDPIYQGTLRIASAD